MRFLIVDDSSTMRRNIINTLYKLGHRDIVEALRAGVNSYVVKPFTPDTIREKIDAVLAS